MMKEKDFSITSANSNHANTSDVIVLGGGIIGLSIARELKKLGAEKVTILEKNSVCGAEASSAAAGMLAPQAEADAADDFFRFCAQSRDLYPKFAEELKEETGINIELDQTGTLYLAFTEQDAEELEKRFAWQKAADLPVEKLSAKEVLQLEPNISPKVLFGLRFPNDWRVENRKIISALVKLAKQNEVEIFAGTKVLNFEEEKDGNFVISSTNGIFRAGKLVLASGAWLSEIDLSFNLQDKIIPIRGQMFSAIEKERFFSHVIYSRRGYLVPCEDNELLIGATVEDVGFDNKVTPAGLSFLTKNALEISEKIADMTFFENWSGLRPKSADGLPILGEFPASSGLFWATGHYRNGILLAPLTGKIIAEKIVKNQDNEFLRTFNPARFFSKATSKSSESRFFDTVNTVRTNQI